MRCRAAFVPVAIALRSTSLPARWPTVRLVPTGKLTAAHEAATVAEHESRYGDATAAVRGLLAKALGNRRPRRESAQGLCPPSPPCLVPGSPAVSESELVFPSLRRHRPGRSSRYLRSCRSIARTLRARPRRVAPTLPLERPSERRLIRTSTELSTVSTQRWGVISGPEQQRKRALAREFGASRRIRL
jgi:hypothetical protein